VSALLSTITHILAILLGALSFGIMSADIIDSTNNDDDRSKRQ